MSSVVAALSIHPQVTKLLMRRGVAKGDPEGRCSKNKASVPHESSISLTRVDRIPTRPLPVSPPGSRPFVVCTHHQVMRIDWKPIILWGGGAGALVAFWAGLWITGFLMAWSEDWLHPGIEVPARTARGHP